MGIKSGSLNGPLCSQNSTDKTVSLNTRSEGEFARFLSRG